MFLQCVIVWAAALAICSTSVVLGSPPANRGAASLASPASLHPRFTPEEIEFIPGAGLPSLESLNLTAVQLVNKALLDLANETASALLTRRDATCWTQSTGSFYRASALSCATYLEALPTNTICKLFPSSPSEFYSAVFCTMTLGDDPYNKAIVEGINPHGNFPTQSYCEHVAHAVRVVEAGCVISIFRSKNGNEFAYGNGDLQVGTYLK